MATRLHSTSRSLAWPWPRQAAPEPAELRLGLGYRIVLGTALGPSRKLRLFRFAPDQRGDDADGQDGDDDAERNQAGDMQDVEQQHLQADVDEDDRQPRLEVDEAMHH